MEYIYTGFFTLLLGSVVLYNPVIMFFLYYIVTRFMFKNFFFKDTTKLDDFYLFIPRFFKLTEIINFIKDWLIMPLVDFFTWIPQGIVYFLKLLIQVFIFLLDTVPSYILKLIKFLFDTFVIVPLRMITDYIIELTDWHVYGYASDYAIDTIVKSFEFYFFQIQQLLNQYLFGSFKHLLKNFNPPKIIDLPDSAFILKNII
jgi:hypothetical protein